MNEYEKGLLLDHLARCNAYLLKRRQFRKPSRGAIMRTLKAKLLLDFECRCFWCGRRCRVAPRCKNDPEYATVDHYIPKFFQGRDVESNLRLSCLSCNSLRGTLLNQFIQEKYTPRLWDLI